MKRPFKGVFSLILIALVAVFFAIVIAESNSTTEITYSQLMQNISNGQVTDIKLSSDGKQALVNMSGKKGETLVYIPSLSAFMESIKDDISSGKINVKEDSPSVVINVLSYLPSIALLIVFLLFISFFSRSMGNGNGAMSFTKNRARLSDPDGKDKIMFKDVAGLPEEMEELEEIVEFLKYPKKYTDMGARIPKGVLLVGQPGTGKTLLAKAVAGEAGVPFYSISGSDFVEMYVGVGASRVRDLFQTAKEKAPCIVFIDEIDAVGRQRGAGLGGGHDEREQTLNQLLVEMDGFGTNSGVIVLAATNRPDILDKALLRAGRFDRQIVVPSPDVRGREEILNLYAKKKKLEGDIDLGLLAKNTAGFVGADLENMLNEAAIRAAREDRAFITDEDIKKSFIKIGIGTERKSRIISDKEKKITAYHESGHAILFHELPLVGNVYTISVIPTGSGAAGYTMPVPEEDGMFRTKNEILQDIMVTLGGRIAEELIFGDVTTGASQDIKQATKAARGMVVKYGMSSLGMVNYENGDEDEVFIGRDLAHTKSFSDSKAAEIDAEVKRIIDECYAKAKAIIEKNLDVLHASAELLIKKERISSTEFDKLFAKDAI